ncbi:MAG TPA: sigma-70 family RNA polymerase sigma factor [Steroidobacteraceae bacterium]|nr:sigma-70 family RNA polymerase sigma factor [Steroidobacteraceae bacterium]
MNRVLSIVAREIYASPVQYVAETQDDDASLARRIAASDTGAEAEFCRRFAPRIRLFGRKWLRSEAAAADLVQDVLLMALQKLRAGAVRDPERIASFMLGTARQMMVDSRRSSGRRERILDTFPVDLIPDQASATEPLDEQRLRHCLQALPERERAVLVMTFYDDCPADALGRQLGLNAGHVRVIRHRGLDHLRSCMEAEGSQ